MYTVKPLGLNTKDSDRNVADGFLQESINLQWRDGAFKPIADRLSAGIDISFEYSEIIMHKVSDEDQINVLVLATTGVLYWVGIITDNLYSELDSVVEISDFPTITDFDSLSFTILNSLIYFMSSEQEFYYSLQFEETDDSYEVKDMYEWKDLIPFYPKQGSLTFTYDASDKASTDRYVMDRVGCILIRFALVLKTGEVVLHTPPYMFQLVSLNIGGTALTKEDEVIDNIHSFINLDLGFTDDDLYDDYISAINIYASVPLYYNTFDEDVDDNGVIDDKRISSTDMKTEFEDQSQESFYLIKTIDDPDDDLKVLLYAGDIDSSEITYDSVDLDDNDDVYKIDLTTIAAGETMPTDDYSYHRIFGKISSYNGRLLIYGTKTVMSKGYGRALATELDSYMKSGFKADSEDGVLNAMYSEVDNSFTFTEGDSAISLTTRSILSYPDLNCTTLGFAPLTFSSLAEYSLSENESHNVAACYDMKFLTAGSMSITKDGTTFTIVVNYDCTPIYVSTDYDVDSDVLDEDVFYTSSNRFQHSEYGEFAVWPVDNSYRVGDGKLLFVGNNSVNPANSDYIAPLIIGSSDGVYLVNYDTTGTTLIQSINKAANLPAISKETIQIDQDVIYVSDKGLIAMRNGKTINLTENFFAEQGGGEFAVTSNLLGFDLAANLAGTLNHDSVYPSYDLLTADFLSTSNIYSLADIIDYLKDCVFAYDGRRNNLWCSNSRYVFSLVFNLAAKQWNMSTYVFSKAIELYSTLKTDQGEMYSRYIVLNEDSELDILSAEDQNAEVEVLLLTRPIKMQSPDVFKKIERLIARCEIYKGSDDSYFAFGLWGKQDINYKKESIPLVLYSDDSESAFPNDVRQDVPIGRLKGKFKTISILQTAKCLPESSFSGFDIVASPVNNKTIR